MGDKIANRLLVNEIKSIDNELTNIQTVFNGQTVEFEKPLHIKNFLSPIEYTVLVVEMIFLIGVFFIK